MTKIYNLRYRDSVEDRVHQLLSDRLHGIFSLFGQIPDVLEDLWVDVALGKREQARRVIEAVPEKHPFELRYSQVVRSNWENCFQVLNNEAKREQLLKPWSKSKFFSA